MVYWMIHLLNGVAFGSLLFLLASGFTLAFGLMQFINLAHGSFYLLGAYLALTVMRATGSFPVAVAAGTLAVMVLGALAERVFLHRFHLQPLPQVLFTMGLAFLIGDAALVIWGGEPQVLGPPEWLSGAARIGTIFYPKYRLFVIAAGVVVAAGLWLFLERTRAGALVRACVDDEEMALAVGINVRRLFMWMFALAALLAGLGGALGAPLIGAYPGVDFEVLPLALVVVILGGLGSLGGAVLGSVFVGIVDSLGKAMFPELSYFTLFAPMAVVLAIKPTGLLGRD